MDLKIQTKALSESMLAKLSPKNGGDGGGDFGALLKQATTKQSDAAAELEKYVKMTPAERMTQAIMKSLGISPEAFNAMSPAEQASVMAKVAQIMKQKMDEQTVQSQGSAPV